MADPKALARLLLAETDHAAARITLQQAASIEETRAVGTERSGGPAWRFDLPVATPAGIAIAALRIERDDHKNPAGEGDPSGPSFRVDLSLMVEPFGNLDARIGLLPGRRIVVGLWCETADALARLRPGLAGLPDSLRATGLDVGAIDLHVGRPPPSRPDAAAMHHRLDLKL